MAQDHWDDLNDYAIKKREVEDYSGQLRDIEEERDEVLKQFSQSRLLMKPVAQSALKLVSGLRDIFYKKAKAKNADKVYQINLGDLQYFVPNQFDVSLSDLSISVQDIKKNEDGSLSIEVAECSLNLEIITLDGLRYGPVKVFGGFDLTIKKPISEDLSELLGCYFVSLPGKIAKIAKKYSKLMKLDDDENKEAKKTVAKKEEAEGNPFAGITRISDLVDLNISALKVDGVNSSAHSLLSKAGIDPALTLLAPGLEGMRNFVDKQKMKEAESGLVELKNEINRRKKSQRQREQLIKTMEDHASQLFDDFNETKQSVKKIYFYRIENARKVFERRYKSYGNRLLEREEELQQKSEAVEALKKKAVHEGEWLRFVRNVSDVFMSLRAAATNKKKSTSFSLAHRIGENTSQGGSASSRLESLKGQATLVHLDENKALHLHLSGLTSKPSTSVEKDSASPETSGIALKINPPAGKLMHRLLTVDFPFDLEKIKGVVDLFAEVAPPGSQVSPIEKLNQMVEVSSFGSLRSEQERELIIGFLESIGAKRERASQLVAHLKLEEKKPEPVPLVTTQSVAEQAAQPEEASVAGDNTLAPVIKTIPDEHAGEESPVPSREEATNTDMLDAAPQEEFNAAGPAMEDAVEDEGAAGETDLEGAASEAGLGLSAKRADMIDNTVVGEALSGIELSTSESQPLNNPRIEKFLEQAALRSDSQASPSKDTEGSISEQISSTSEAPVLEETISEQEPTTEIAQVTKPVASLPIKKLRALIEVTQKIQGRQAKAHFHITSSLPALFDKLSWFTRLFIGSPDLEIEVSANVDGGEADLAEPVLTVKNGNPLRRFLVNRWLRKAMHKKAIAMSVDYQGKKEKLSLSRRLDFGRKNRNVR